MTTPAQENSRMLASLLGVDEDDAAERLDRAIVITASTEGPDAAWAAEIRALVERTVRVVDAGDDADLELVVGDAEPRTSLARLHAVVDEIGATVGSDAARRCGGPPHPLLSTVAACSVAAALLRKLIDDPALPSVADPLTVDFRDLGIPVGWLDRCIDLSGAVLVGAGAVAHGFLRALRGLHVRGDLAIVDPKQVGEGNANRCLYLNVSDVGRPKAKVLAERAAADHPGLRLEPLVEEFAAFAKRRGPPALAIVTVDSRRARRSIQKEVPGHVLDASTTDVRAVVVHSHRQPNPHACLACIYRHVPDEHARERSIAEGLGIDLKDVMQGFVTPEIATRIARSHPGLREADVVGKAFDTLFKQLCAAQALRTPEGRQVLAPFAFVSCLAGALLVVELVRAASGKDDTNYWTVDPWAAPVGRVRRLRPRNANCEFCARPESEAAARALWGGAATQGRER